MGVPFSLRNTAFLKLCSAVKLHLPLVHIEAGLRSFEKTMPEEVNRVLTDRVADVLFCPTETAVRNLANEGITDGVYQVGDVRDNQVNAQHLFLGKEHTGVDNDDVVTVLHDHHILPDLS